MAIPAYVQASAGATDATGGFTFTGVTSGTVGHIVICQILIDGSVAVDWGTLSATNIEALDATANTWTFINSYTLGSPLAGRMRLYIGRRTSASSAPTFTASANVSGEDVYGRMYEYSGVAAGTTLATILENSSAGTIAVDANTGTTVSDVGVTTIGANRLALNFIGITDDATGLVVFSGASGGTWTNFQIYETSTGTDATIAMETADMVAAGTINGGSDTIVSLPWGVVGFALFGTEDVYQPRSGFVNHVDPGVL